MKNVYLEITNPLGVTTLDWHLTAIGARRLLVATAERLGCNINGNGTAGTLINTAGTIAGNYRIGENK